MKTGDSYFPQTSSPHKENGYIAHFRESDGVPQTVEVHLLEVGELAGQFADKIGMEDAGKILGILHDLGKYSKDFQKYIKSATGALNPDQEEYVEFEKFKGKIDHSTAGAQWIWQRCSRFQKPGECIGQILALCLASHHSGLIDCLHPDGENTFIKRMEKADNKTHLKECLGNVPHSVISELEKLSDKAFLQSFLKQLQLFFRDEQHNQKISPSIKQFYFGFFTRFLFSCLIDGDRISSADFEKPWNKNYRSFEPPKWSIAVSRIENAISRIEIKYSIDHTRRDISNNCKTKAINDQGIYSLTVPTGGGKTYASLRFALHHAKKHNLDRIVYVIPYTSIIEQNAKAVREILEEQDDLKPWALEIHSNLEPETQTWRSKITAENLDSPIVFITMVQFLDILFSGGTRGVRKMHQLAKSVLIFDEVQTLPIKCTHLFCNAINFLTAYTKTTALLCTATQPLLNELNRPEKGELFIPKENELVKDVPKLFSELKRVEVKNRVKPGGWSVDEITGLALSEHEQKGSCLIIVNTKKWAQNLYQACREEIEEGEVFHLSTSLCPAHRKTILKKVKKRLDEELPVLCISTQLIEAGVDIDFASVIRFLAGLDSIAQAAGRCNRNGKRATSVVHVVNPNEENIDLLKDIKVGRDKALRIFSESGKKDYLSPEIMNKYFQYYFYQRSDEMAYPVSRKKHVRDDFLLNLLSENPRNIGKNSRSHLLQQSFMEAGKLFKSIDAPTQAVIVPYEEGKKIISELCSDENKFDPRAYFTLLRKAQKYSVNVFPNIWKKLVDAQAIHEIKEGEGIYYLDSEYYSQEFGLSVESVNPMETEIY
jgi:CRISPR-associated endonuclease/helicase Cas3